MTSGLHCLPYICMCGIYFQCIWHNWTCQKRLFCHTGNCEEACHCGSHECLPTRNGVIQQLAVFMSYQVSNRRLFQQVQIMWARLSCRNMCINYCGEVRVQPIVSAYKNLYDTEHGQVFLKRLCRSWVVTICSYGTWCTYEFTQYVRRNLKDCRVC